MTIEATGRFHLGDDDSKIDGRRQARQEAMRNAIEQAGVYIESVSEVQSFRLTQDRVRSYAAGIVAIEDVEERWESSGESWSVVVVVRAVIDPTDVAKQIDRLRKSEESTKVLARAQDTIRTQERKIERLTQELGTLTGARAEAARRDRRDALDVVDAEQLVAAAEVEISGQKDRAATSIIGNVPQNRLERASELYSRALALKPDHVPALSGIAAVAVHRAQYAEGVSLYRRALAIEPDDAVSRAGFASALYGVGDLNEAIEQAREAVRLDAKLASAHATLGFLLLTRGDLAGSIEAYRVSTRINESVADYHQMLGFVLMKAGKLSEAEAEVRVAIRLNPDYATAHNNLGYVCAARGNRVAARTAFEEGCRLGSANSCDRVRELEDARESSGATGVR